MIYPLSSPRRRESSLRGDDKAARTNFIKKTLAAILLLSAVSTIAYADVVTLHLLDAKSQTAFQKVQTQLSKAHTISGEFRQIRKMRLLSTPLISKGQFTLSKDHGLSWHQTYPFDSKLIVTASKIEQRIGDNPPNIITKEQQPVAFTFSNIFLSIFNGDTASIQTYFKIYFVGDTTHWKIVLKPIGPPIDKAIKSIAMEGGQYVHSITIQEAKQNQMTLIFTHVQTL